MTHATFQACEESHLRGTRTAARRRGGISQNVAECSPTLLRQSFAVSCLKLLNQQLHVGGDDFFGGLGLRGGGKGGNVVLDSGVGRMEAKLREVLQSN